MTEPQADAAPPRACDVLVIGAGPAGLAAATIAAKASLATVLVDEQAAPGGQIYRGIAASPLRDPSLLGQDYLHGATLLPPFLKSGAIYVPRTSVWGVTPAGDAPQGAAYDVALSRAGVAHLVRAKAVVLATGALERPFPIPGWTLPGVMGAGAAQVLLKTAAMVPRCTTVLAGSGPLLYLYAWQMLRVGGRVAALLDTTPRGRWREAGRHALSFLASPYFLKGLRLVHAVRRAVPVTGPVEGLEARGEGRLETVRYLVGGREQNVRADLLLLHQGVVPDVNLASAIGCAQEWDDALACFRPVTDAWGATSLANVWAAGDGAGIEGARAAEHRGRLAALDAARALGVVDAAQRNRLAATDQAALARARRGRRFFDAWFAPSPASRAPPDETILCRCEEVTAGAVRAAVAQGCPGPNQMKAFLRCGMGPCQGRLCGLAVVDVIARARGVAAAEVGYYRLRMPVKPLTLGELAALPQTDASKAAVVRLRK